MYIKNPSGRHKGFRLIEIRLGKHCSIKLPELSAINADFLTGKLEKERARQLVEALRKRATKPKLISWLPENQQIVEAFWKEHAEPRAKSQPQAAYDRIKWAIKQLGSTSLISSSMAELKTALSHLDNDGQRRAIGPINRILKYKKLTEKCLVAPDKIRKTPQYLTTDEGVRVIRGLAKKEWRLACAAAFGTGARYGELFAMQSQNLRKGGAYIWIEQQQYKNLKLGPTKNRKVGAAFILPEFRKQVQEWVALPSEIKQEMRKKALPAKQFQQSVSLHLHRDFTMHNLRHSYAKYLLERGASLEQIAGYLRDSMRTVEEYYLSWVDSDAEMDAMVKRFG